VPIELKAGGVIAFCFNTPHRTGRNDTDGGRAGLAYHFMRAGHVGKWVLDSNPNFVEFPLWGEEGRRHGPILSGPGYTAGRQEYGEDMEGRLRGEVARLAG